MVKCYSILTETFPQNNVDGGKAYGKNIRTGMEGI